MLSNAVVLRDIPKEEAILDLFRYPIQGGFRGFYAIVPIIGWHHASVKGGDHHKGFWFYLHPQEAVVRRYEYGQGFVEDEPTSVTQYSQLALSGAMGPALVEYPPQLYAHWFGLTRFIPEGPQLPQLHEEDGPGSSRFARAWQGTHQGNHEAFLAEFQTAFLRSLVSQKSAEFDEAAELRWRHLLLSTYNAGEYQIQEAAPLFENLVDVLLRQFALLPDPWFEKGSFVVAQIGYMIEDMEDSGVPELAPKAAELKRYLDQRR